MINEMKDLLPVGSIVLLKGGVKKTVIIGVLQVSEENPEEMYDYIGVPYPEGYLGEDNAFNRKTLMMLFSVDMKILKEKKC